MTKSQVKRYRSQREREARHRAAVEEARAALAQHESKDRYKQLAFGALAIIVLACVGPLVVIAIEQLVQLT